MKKPEEAGETAAPEDSDATEAAEEVADVRDKFRKALERKRGRQAKQRSAGAGKQGQGIHEAHGPAVGRREFRRKSG